MLTPAATIAVIGLGPPGSRLAEQLARHGCAVRAHDSQLEGAATRSAMSDHIEALGADPCSNLPDALRGARLVIAAVPGDESAVLAGKVSRLLQPGQIYLDVSGADAAVHRTNAGRIEHQGAIYSAGHAGAALLIAGPHALRLAEALQSLGCRAQQVAQLPGPATAPPAAPLRRVARRGELP